MSAPSPAQHSLHLLSLAKTITRRERSQARARGEEFNLFEVLKIGDYEVTTHSRILAELLDPQGTHGQGGVFLRLFLRELTGFDLPGFDADNAIVQTEMSAGLHGRIDIVIDDRRRQRRIFIENKIHAQLGDHQLEGYRTFDPKAHILYLTKHGEEAPLLVPAAESISYRVHIIAWLENCRREAAMVPSVREAITHYLHLVRRLTDQNPFSHMNQELIEAVLHNKESYLAYAGLRNADWEIRKTLLARVNKHLTSYAAAQGLKITQLFALGGKRYEGCFFTTPALEAANLQFGIECDKGDYQDFLFGFKFTKLGIGSPLQSRVEASFSAEFGPTGRPADWWPAWQWWNLHRNWNDETMSAIISGDFMRDVDELLSRLKNVATRALDHQPPFPASPTAPHAPIR